MPTELHGIARPSWLEPRTDNFVWIELGLEQSDQELERAPFWAIDCLESTFRGLAALRPARGTNMERARFERLQKEAEALKQRGLDPEMSVEEYTRSPRQVSAAGQDAPYYAPTHGSPPRE